MHIVYHVRCTKYLKKPATTDYCGWNKKAVFILFTLTINYLYLQLIQKKFAKTNNMFYFNSIIMKELPKILNIKRE